MMITFIQNPVSVSVLVNGIQFRHIFQKLIGNKSMSTNIFYFQEKICRWIEPRDGLVSAMISKKSLVH